MNTIGLPFAGDRGYYNFTVYDRGTLGGYLSSTPNNNIGARGMYFLKGSSVWQTSSHRSYGFSVRCFKNSPLVTYISDGVEIATQKSTEAAPTPSKNGYTLVGWYDNPEFTGSAVDISSITEDVTVYAKWHKDSCEPNEEWYDEI